MFLKVAKMFLENMLSIQNWRSVRFIQEIDTFIQQECIKLIKSESEGIYNITKYIWDILFQTYAVLLNFLLRHFF